MNSTVCEGMETLFEEMSTVIRLSWVDLGLLFFSMTVFIVVSFIIYSAVKKTNNDLDKRAIKNDANYTNLIRIVEDFKTIHKESMSKMTDAMTHISGAITSISESNRTITRNLETHQKHDDAVLQRIRDDISDLRKYSAKK